MSEIAAITFDMDDLDVMAEGYGIKEPFHPAVYRYAIHRILDLLDEANVKATFFVIANKALTREARQRVREVVDRGHEIANHSLRHENLLGKTQQETYCDTDESTRILSDIIGKQIIGYRGPSLTFNKYHPDILMEMGYKYDSSVNPTNFFILEWLYLSLVNPSIRNMPKTFYVQHGFARSKPYFVSHQSLFKSCATGPLVELPISNARFLRLPFYPTLHFMFPFLYPCFKNLFLTNPYLIFHAHALDFLDLDSDRIPDAFKRHPSLRLPLKNRMHYFRTAFSDMKFRDRRVVTASEMAKSFRAAKGRNDA